MEEVSAASSSVGSAAAASPSDNDDAALCCITQQVHDAMCVHRDAQSSMPFITLTYAQSIDGSIAAVRGTPTLLSGAQSMTMTHVLRTMHDAILVGVGTVLADNPSLNARFAQGNNPKPVVVDTSLRCPLTIKLFTSPACEKPIILCGDTSTNQVLQQRRQALELAGATVLECRTTVDAHVDIRHGLELLRSQLGLQSVMVEGGAAILTACLAESARTHLVDSVVVTIAPVFIGGLRAVGSLLATATTTTLETTATTMPEAKVVAPTIASVKNEPSASVATIEASTTTFPRLRRQPTFVHARLGDDLVLVGRL